MSEKILCPWCGHEMNLACSKIKGKESYQAQYMCNGCCARSSILFGANKEVVKARVTELALRRYQPENRVLTLEEVYKIDNDAPYYIEINKIEGVSVYSCGEEIKSDLVPYFGEDRINKTWRVWLRKPTEEERKAVKWDE